MTQESNHLIFPAPVRPTIAIENSTQRFPVRRIYCVGRNYLEHIREMGGNERELPFFFQKPTDAIVENNATVAYPVFTQDFQHEIELVLAIGKEGAFIQEEDAASHVFGLAVGIDLTRRDVQINARKAGRPWEVGKSFDESAPCGNIVPLDGELPTTGSISIDVNGQRKQQGDLSQLIWSCKEMIKHLSEQYRLYPGDLIYTGTPAGVAPVKAGDVIVGHIDKLPSLTITIG
jgi:fumarylpyruvate hydrolase